VKQDLSGSTLWVQLETSPETGGLCIALHFVASSTVIRLNLTDSEQLAEAILKMVRAGEEFAI
jgi:hypothetical protein